jgi:trans-aconitate methyltransferase
MCHVLSRVSRRHFESVIDFGCGDGSILSSLVQEIGAVKAKGVDLKTPKVCSNCILFYKGDILKYVVDEQYQLVISNQVFEHIYEPWLPKYFEVLKASCSPGGLILISTPNRWRPKNIVRALTCRQPYMMRSNPGVPMEKHLGHHRECSYRELVSIMRHYFPENEWHVRIIRTVPRVIDSTTSWLVNILVYFSFWPIWRTLFVSASQDHYVVIQRKLPAQVV